MQENDFGNELIQKLYGNATNIILINFLRLFSEVFSNTLKDINDYLSEVLLPKKVN